jgi:Flp pilus assembly protein TadB
VAKKVRQKPEESDPARHFEFPTFDELKFLRHEFEQTSATLVAFVFALGLGALAFLITWAALPALLAAALSLVLIAFSPWLIRRIRASATDYTRGEWAGLVLIEIFGWLGFWFLLTDLVH